LTTWEMELCSDSEGNRPEEGGRLEEKAGLFNTGFFLDRGDAPSVLLSGACLKNKVKKSCPFVLSMGLQRGVRDEKKKGRKWGIVCFDTGRYGRGNGIKIVAG